MKKKILFTLAAPILAATILSTNVYAYGPNFDPVYYANEYPDVVNVFGNDPDLLYNHYVYYGIAEGRYQNQYEEDNKIVNSSNIDLANPASLVTPIPGYSTYVDVDISLQLVTYFEDGDIKFQSSCVTGNKKGHHDTPKGTFSILTKVPGKRLKGPTWNCWVNRWMKFTNTSCGFHDASWRNKFGGSIYNTNGSHGCVNLPPDKARELYDLIKVGTTVIVH